MKKSNLVKASIILLGSIISIGSAFALYQSQTSISTTINISTDTLVNADTTITYQIAKDNVDGKVTPTYLDASGNEGTKIDDTHTKVKYVFPLSASYSAHAQDYVVGNAKVTISAIDTYTKAHATFWAEMDGYTDTNGYSDTSIGATSYRKPFMSTNYALSNLGEGVTSYSVSSDITVESEGKQSIVVYIEYDSVDLGSINSTSAPFSLTVNWGKPSDSFNFAYIVGYGNQWASNGTNYNLCPRMVPNIKSSVWEWYYKNLGSEIGEFKFYCNGTYNNEDNFKYESGKLLNCYWNTVTNSGSVDDVTPAA